jgi:hypothetical protein
MSFWKWSRTAANNATADGSINSAERQAPSTVNDSARATTAAASNGRFKTSVRLQRSLAIVAAFMFCPIAGAGPYRFRNSRLQSMMMFDRRDRLSGSRKARV